MMDELKEGLFVERKRREPRGENGSLASSLRQAVITHDDININCMYIETFIDYF